MSRAIGSRAWRAFGRARHCWGAGMAHRGRRGTPKSCIRTPSAPSAPTPTILLLTPTAAFLG
eukprot:7235537-Prymnesium_polylepis.1